MRARAIFLGLLSVVACCLFCPSASRPAYSQEKRADERSLTVTVKADFQPVTVTLYRDGKAILTRDVEDGATHKFSKLPRGNYEAHFESPQRVTQIKKVALEDFDSELSTTLAKGKETVVLGGGPSVQELEKRIKTLEEAVTKLQGK